VFYVVRGGNGLWLFSGCGYPGGFWGGDDYWVFVRPAS